MSKILEMRQKRAETWDRAKAFLDEHTNENGVMSAEDTQQYERMEQEVVDLGHAIERMERAEQMDRQMNDPTSRPLASRPEKSPTGRMGRASDEYKQAVIDALAATDGVEGITGSYTFNETNDPIKSAAMIQLQGGAEVFTELY